MSGIERRNLDRRVRWIIDLDERDAVRMHRERMELLKDAIWIVEVALRGDIEKWGGESLTTPRLGLPVS